MWGLALRARRNSEVPLLQPARDPRIVRALSEVSATHQLLERKLERKRGYSCSNPECALRLPTVSKWTSASAAVSANEGLCVSDRNLTPYYVDAKARIDPDTCILICPWVTRSPLA